MVARREGFEPPTARSVAWCSASIWTDPDRSGLLRLDAPSIQTAPEGSRRIVWMINRMIKQVRRPGSRSVPAGPTPVPPDNRGTGQVPSSRFAPGWSIMSRVTRTDRGNGRNQDKKEHLHD